MITRILYKGIMLRYVVFCFVVLAGVHGGSKFSDEDKEALHALIKPIVTTCMEKFGLDPAEFESEKEKEDGDPCVMACVFKGTGVLDAKGMFDKDAALAFLKEAVTSEDSLKEASEFGNTCEKVNKEDVSDGAEGCERAALIAKCIKEHKSDVELQ